jgi:hypothetical protein
MDQNFHNQYTLYSPQQVVEEEEVVRKEVEEEEVVRKEVVEEEVEYKG